MIDNTTRLRRLRNVVKAVLDLDPDAADLSRQLATLKERADLALKETKMKQGNPVNLGAARKKAHETHRRKGKATEDRILPILKALRAEGFKTYKALAEGLNRRGIRPPEAKSWSPRSVHIIETRARPKNRAL